MSKTKQEFITKTILYIIFGAVGFMVIVPILYAFAGSFRSNLDMLAHPEILIPREPTLENYKIAFSSEDFNVPRMLWNSTYFSVITTVAMILSSSMAGYVFARNSFPGKNIILGTFTVLMFLSVGGISIYPKFEVINLFGLGNNLWGYILIKALAVNVVNTILIKSYVQTLPVALDESAELDGCNFMQTFFSIILPLLKPIIVTVAILGFNGSWNEYVMPSIFTMGRPDQQTLIAGVVALKNTDEGAASWTLMLAGTTVALIPVLVVYVFGNKYMVSGLSAGAVKG